MASRQTFKEVKRALEHHRERLMSIPGVVGLAVGKKVKEGVRRSDYSIRVYVRQKHKKANLPKSKLVPSRVRGVTEAGKPASFYVPTDVVKGSGELAALSLQGGQTILGHTGQRGTIGFAYQSMGGRSYMLTNAHVAVGVDFELANLTTSTRLTEPPPGQSSAVVRRFSPILSNGTVNEMDAALALVDSAQQTTRRTIRGESATVDGQEPFDDSADLVYRYTNRNGVKKFYRHPDAADESTVRFSSGEIATFRNFTVLTGAPGLRHLVEAGDSGSLLVRENNGSLLAVGLVFAGVGNRIAVYPIESVTSSLGQASAGNTGAENVEISFA